MVFLQMEQTRIEQTNRQKGKTSNGFSTIDTTRTALLWYYETTHNCGRDYNLFTNQGNPAAHPNVKTLRDAIDSANW